MMELVEYADCVETFEGVREALEAVERRLAEELRIPVRNIRKHLYAKTRNGTLLETSLVAEWHGRYAAYADWVSEAQAAGAEGDELLASSCGPSEPEAAPPRSSGPQRETQEAARAASCF